LLSLVSKKDSNFHRTNWIPIGVNSDLFLIKKRGKPAIIGRIARTKNISLICAITNKEVLGFKCFKGGITATDFGCFLIELLNNHEEILENISDYVFCLGQCSDS